MSPRAGLRAAVCAFGLAAVLVAAVGPPAQESPAEAASHEARPAGSVWAAGTAGAATWQWTHTNLWTCDAAACTGGGIGQGRRGATASTSCLPRAATAGAAYAAGCGGHNPGNSGWRFTGHDDANTGSKVPGSVLYACAATPGEQPVSDPAHCGAWVECTGNTVPNAAKTGCRQCLSGDAPDHSTGETCHGHDPKPACPTGNTAPVVITWTYHSAAGADVTGTETCGVPRCPAGQHRHGAGACGDDHAHGSVGPDCATGLAVDTTVRWVYHNAAGADARGEKVCPRAGSGGGGGGAPQVDCAAVQRLVRPFGKVRNFVRALYDAGRDSARANAATPHPLNYPVSAAPWLPAVEPAGPVDAGAGEPFEVASSAGGDWLAAGKPSGWTRSGRLVQQPGETAPTWEPGSEIYKQVRCAEVTVAHAGAGWRLTNLALADPEAATSGTGRGRRTFTAAGLVDDTKPAGFAAYDRWTVTVELAQSVGAPFPPCTFSAWFLASGGTNADPRLGVTAAGTARPAANPHRSCSWTVTLWDAAVVRLNPCGKDRRPAVLDDDGNVLRHQDLRGAVRDSDGNVLYCAWPGV